MRRAWALLVLWADPVTGTSKRVALPDPCAGAPNLEGCHYDQALAVLDHMQSQAAGQVKESVQEGAQGNVAASMQAATVNLDCSFPPNEAECSRRRQALALFLALQALEGQPLIPKSLDSTIAILEENYNAVEYNGVEVFRENQLSVAINDKRKPASLAKRVTQAVKALERIQWPSESSVPSAVEALRKLAAGDATSGGKNSKSLVMSLLSWLSDSMHRWMTWRPVGAEHPAP
mmetsp:Transcript_55003/g.106177  ORF Transcript_55003/g.106177 Transcript_55003/m.106177 type:complete len:233 (+) Transcript_55003:94-792(+)